MRLMGVDGCRGGWLVAEAASLRAAPAFFVVRHFQEIVRLVEASEATAFVDVPIGLSAAARGRPCDAEARAMLGSPRSSSVFTPPSRQALRGRSDAERRRLNVRATGRSLSAQALGILPKIEEVDRIMTPRLQRLIRETHPEVVFARLGRARTGLAAGKKTAAGRGQRLRLLPRAFAAAAPTSAARPFPADIAALDDYVDALAALVAAVHAAHGTGRRLPRGGHDRDDRGLLMEIAY